MDLSTPKSIAVIFTASEISLLQFLLHHPESFDPSEPSVQIIQKKLLEAHNYLHDWEFRLKVDLAEANKPKRPDWSSSRP